MCNEVVEHQKKIDRLRNIDRDEMYQRNLSALLDSVRSKRLTVEDVLMFTNIPKDQLDDMLQKEGL